MNIPTASPRKWRKKPIVIEAAQVPPVDAFDDRLSFQDWINPRRGGRTTTWVGDKLSIETLEGTMMADVGDYVICGVQGELYPCKPDIFEATYEPA
jgi:hypothetical protein